jgi:Ni/Co efflux regulator RcnB
MRKLLLSVAVLGLLGGTTPALAQDHDRGGRPRGGEHGAAQGAPDANGRNAIGQRQFREHHDVPSPRPAAPPQRAQTPADAAAQQMRGINRAFGNQPQPNAGRRDNNNRPDVRRPGNRPDAGDRGRSDNRRRPGFNDNRPRRDFSHYRNYHRNFRAERRFRAPAYRRPPGWYAHRWSWGETLPFAFWSRDYWLMDFGIYNLPAPPFGAVWVRVGDDALLIDRDTGEIIEVDYGVFY